MAKQYAVTFLRMLLKNQLYCGEGTESALQVRVRGEPSGKVTFPGGLISTESDPSTKQTTQRRKRNQGSHPEERQFVLPLVAPLTRWDRLGGVSWCRNAHITHRGRGHL